MCELLTARIGRRGFGRAIVGLDHWRRAARTGTDDHLVAVSHTAADDDGTDERADHQEPASTAARLLDLVLAVVVVIIALGLLGNRQRLAMLGVIAIGLMIERLVPVSVRILPLLLVVVPALMVIIRGPVTGWLGRLRRHVTAEIIIAGIVLRLLPLIELLRRAQVLLCIAKLILGRTKLVTQAGVRRTLLRLLVLKLRETVIKKRLRSMPAVTRLILRRLRIRALLIGGQVLLELRREALLRLRLRSRRLITVIRRARLSGLRMRALLRKMVGGIRRLLIMLRCMAVRVETVGIVPVRIMRSASRVVSVAIRRIRLLRVQRRPLIRLMCRA